MKPEMWKGDEWNVYRFSIISVKGEVEFSFPPLLEKIKSLFKKFILFFGHAAQPKNAGSIQYHDVYNFKEFSKKGEKVYICICICPCVYIIEKVYERESKSIWQNINNWWIYIKGMWVFPLPLNLSLCLNIFKTTKLGKKVINIPWAHRGGE